MDRFTEAYTVAQVGPYSEYGPAHERAMTLQRHGARSIRIDKAARGWIVTFHATTLGDDGKIYG